MATATSRRDRFTATGRPMPAYKKPTAWETSCPWGLQAPILPPFRFTDDSIIPVIVCLQEFDTDGKFQG
jgi:hypothetical protein